MLDKLNTDIKRTWIVALYVLIGILFSGLIPGFQPIGILLIISGIVIGVTLFEVYNYQPNGKTKLLFWLIFIVLIGIIIQCFFKPVNTPILGIHINYIISAVMLIISFIIGKKEWM